MKKLISSITTITLLYSSGAYSAPAVFFNGVVSAGETTFRNTITTASSGAVIFSVDLVNLPLNGSYFTATVGNDNVYVRATQTASAPQFTNITRTINGTLTNLGGFTWAGDPDPQANNAVDGRGRISVSSWSDVVSRGLTFSFYSDSGLTTPRTINAVGLRVFDWGTCCELRNNTPDFTSLQSGPGIDNLGSRIYGLFSDGVTTTTNLIGNIVNPTNRGDTDSDNVHFVAAIDDRNSFSSFTLAPNGDGEVFGAGGTLLFSLVPVGSVPAGSSQVTAGAPVNPTIPDINTSSAFYTTTQRSQNQVTTLFTGGVLRVIGTSTVTDNFTINNNSGTIDTNGNDVQFTGVFSNVANTTGGLTKTGNGTLTFTRVNTYTGTTTINQGTLMIGDSVSNSTAQISGSTQVNTDGTLAGYGVVGVAGTTLTNSGIVAPGGSGLGTLTVGGAYVQNTGGILSIGITPSSNDLIAINETANLSGVVAINADSGSYAPGRFTILTSGGRSGSFSALATNLSSYTALGYFLSYDANNVYLVLGPDYVNTAASLTRNYEQLKSVMASQSSLLISGLNYDCSIFGENDICITTGGRTSHIFNKNDGYDSQVPMTTSALLIGAYRYKPNLRLGGWVDQNLYTQDSNVRMSNSKPMLGLFAVHNPSGDNSQWQYKASLSYSEKDLEISRVQLLNTEPGKGQTTLRGLAAQLEVAYGFSGLMPSAVVSPFLGVRYQNSRVNNYSENINSNVQVPISYDKFRELSSTVFSGVKLDGRYSTDIRYFLSAGIEKDTSRNTPSFSGTSNIYGLNYFNIDSGSKPRDTRGFLSGGVSYFIGKNESVNLGVHYRQDQFRQINSLSTMITYTVGL